MMSFKRLAVGVVLLCTTCMAYPQTGIYAGAAIGEANAKNFDAASVATAMSAQNLATNTTDVDNTHSAWKLYVGYRPLPYLAVEGAYVHLGRFTFDALTTSDPGSVNGATQFDDWSASLVGILPLSERFDAFAKAGAGYWRSKLSASGVGAGSTVANQTANGWRPVFGAGGRAHITPSVAIRAEWEFYKSLGDANKTGKSDIGVWSVGLQYTF